MATKTQKLGLNKPGAGEYGWDALLNANTDTLDAVVGQLVDERAVSGTATGGSATTLIDSSLAMGTDAFAGAVIVVRRAGNVVRIERVVSNTADTFTFASGGAVQAGDTYTVSSQANAIPIAEKGAANGVATLDANGDPMQALAANNGKAIPLPADTNLEAWANGLPASGLYNVRLTAPQGNLPARFWYIELMRHNNDGATNLYHTMRATSLSLGSNVVYMNTCQTGVWSGWVECGVNRALTWYTPTFVNGWADYASGYSARYAQDSMGLVHMKGLVKGGSNTTSTTIFTLPAGMRPSTAMHFAGVTAGGGGTILISYNGSVIFTGAQPHTGNATTWLSIQAVFKGEQ